MQHSWKMIIALDISFFTYSGDNGVGLALLPKNIKTRKFTVSGQNR
jgi:hypothetical protein